MSAGDVLILGLGFLTGFLLVFGANLLLADLVEARRQEARRRLEEELRKRAQERAAGSLQYKDLYEMAAQGLREIRVRQTPWQRFVQLVEESGLTWQPGQLALLCLGLFLAAGAGSGVLTRQWPLALAIGIVAAVIPVVVVAAIRLRRREKLLSQLPDAFDLMSRSLKAGQTITQAFQAVAEEFSPPVSEEFGYCYDQQNLGLSPEAAMRDLARRTGLLEIKIFVLAVMVHRQTGGNLSELLDKLSRVIRERYRIRGAIQALTAEGRMQAIILLALPFVILAIMTIINRPYAMILFQHPWLLVAMGISMIIGAFWMQKIINFDY